MDSLELQLDGDIDIPSFLGLKKDGNPGYMNVKIKAFVKSNASREKLNHLLELAAKHSPVTNTVLRGAQITQGLA